MLAKKNNLILVLSLLLVAGFLATSLASYYVSRASLRLQIDQSELPLTSDNIYSKIQHDLLRPIFISSLMANDTFVRDWVVQGEADTEQITRYLKEIQLKYNTFTSFFVSEQSRNYYHADGLLKKVSPDAERDAWYFRVRDMQPDYEINVDPDLANKDAMTIFINYKVFDYDGKIIGATGVGLTVNAVKQLIEEYQKTFNRSIYFVDLQGQVTLHGSSHDQQQSHLGQIEGVAPLAAQILSSKESTYRFKRGGKIIHLNTRFIPEFQWYLLVEQGENGAMEKIYQALLMNLLICALVVTVVLVMINASISTYQRRLEKIATIDKQTGAYNRLAFEIIFERTLDEIQRSRVPLSMLLFDIDHFKQINDSLGHLIGDEVIKRVAELTAEQIRKSDTLARWGGDEFLVLLKDCSSEAAAETAEKIRVTIAENLKPRAVTVSLGIAEYRPDETGDSFLARADRALYMAKNEGRNRLQREGSAG